MKEKLKKLWDLLRDPRKMKQYARWIMAQMKGFWPSLLSATAANIALVLIGFCSSFISREVVDSATAGAPYGRAFAVMITVSAFNIGLSAAVSIWQTMINEKFAFSIRMKNFSHFLSADYLRLSKYHSGDLLTRLTSDTGTVVSSLTSAIPSLIMIFIRLVVAFFLLYRFSPFLAMAALLLAPGGLLVSLITGGKLKKLSIEAKENEAAYRSFLQERTAHMAVIKTFCMEEKSREELAQLAKRSLDITLRRSRMSAATGLLIRGFFTLGYLLSFGYCISGLHNGTLTYGTMTLFLSLFSQIQQPLVSLTHLLPQAIGLLASADRIMEIEEIPDEMRLGNTELPGEVSVCFENVSFSYGERNVLAQASFEIPPHQLIGVMGPSGVGKTTLIRLILSLMQPTEGKIIFRCDGKAEPLSADVRRMIAYVPQGNTLLSGTIRDNLRWGKEEASEEEMLKALEEADAGFVRALPDGLDTELGEKAAGLSEGQAQRIAIARALLRRAPVMILDEATSALDEESEKRILTRLSQEGRAYTPLCFIITHRRSMLPYFDGLLEVKTNGSIAFSSQKEA